MKGSRQQAIMTLAGVFWALGIALMVVATFTPPKMLVLAGWGLMSALWACVWTGWALLLEERTRVETICRLAYQAEDGDNLRSV